MLIFQKLFIQRSTGSNNLDNLTLHNTFCFLGVLHLLANGNAITLFNQLGNVTIYGMVRHTAHRHSLLAFGQGNIQFTGRSDCILKKHFVKISQTEEQQIIGMLFLNSQILLHHGGVISHYLPPYLSLTRFVLYQSSHKLCRLLGRFCLPRATVLICRYGFYRSKHLYFCWDLLPKLQPLVQ